MCEDSVGGRLVSWWCSSWSLLLASSVTWTRSSTSLMFRGYNCKWGLQHPLLSMVVLFTHSAGGWSLTQEGPMKDAEKMNPGFTDPHVYKECEFLENGCEWMTCKNEQYKSRFWRGWTHPLKEERQRMPDASPVVELSTALLFLRHTQIEHC